MGNLMHVLKKDVRHPDRNIFLDFENAQPTPEEQEIFAQVKEVLDQAESILADLRGYQGAGEQIRLAISSPSNEEAQTQAWEAVVPLVGKLKVFYNYSSEVERRLPILLEQLCTEDPLGSLEKKQALSKQMADVIHFVLKFDDLKMTNPAIQNDFSYYRRTLSRMKMHDPGSDSGVVVNNEEANRMSLFYASPTPMLKCISDATSKFVAEHKEIPLENTTDCLGAMATICRIMIETPEYSSRFHNKDTILFCQRVMVGCIILYDHVHLLGAFSKKNPAIDMRATIKALKMHDNQHLEGLMNALRYTTKHLNDEDTPKQVKSMLS